VTYLDQFLS